MTMSLANAARTILSAPGPAALKAPDGPLRISMMIETVGLGGAEVVMLQLAEELRQRGHTVLPVGPARVDGWLKDRFVELGFGWHEYRWDRSVDWGCVERLAQFFRDARVDVSHGHEFVAGVYGAAAARLAGIPHVSSMHGSDRMTRKLQRRMALRWAFRRSHTAAVSHDTKAHLQESLGSPGWLIDVVHNGIPERPGDRAAARRAMALADADLLVLAVGSLSRRKGHHVLLEAMHRIHERPGVPRWKVAIAGEGVERSALEEGIQRLGLRDSVVLLGNRDDIPDLQAAADVFVMPSLWEGLPLAVLEAMFAGNPVIATTASGMPEAIDDGVHGLLVPPDDAIALGDAIHRLLTRPGERSKLGDAARQRAHSQFSVRVMTDAYERLYRRPLPPSVASF